MSPNDCNPNDRNPNDSKARQPRFVMLGVARDVFAELKFLMQLERATGQVLHRCPLDEHPNTQN